MKADEWTLFTHIRADFKKHCTELLDKFGYTYTAPDEKTKPTMHSYSGKNLITEKPLHILQQEAAQADGTPEYPQETPIVYNHALESIRQTDDIKIIMIGDNPGKNEQLHKNQRYLVGQAGKIACGFFSKNPDLGIDFRSNVIILNKTVIHTAKTKQLHYLLKNTASEHFRTIFNKDQEFCAEIAVRLQKGFGCELWLVGYGELYKNKLFNTYAKKIKELYSDEKTPPVYVYQHFSMNRFSIDLKNSRNDSLSLKENLHLLGKSRCKEILELD